MENSAFFNKKKIKSEIQNLAYQKLLIERLKIQQILKKLKLDEWIKDFEASLFLKIFFFKTKPFSAFDDRTFIDIILYRKTLSFCKRNASALTVIKCFSDYSVYAHNCLDRIGIKTNLSHYKYTKKNNRFALLECSRHNAMERGRDPIFLKSFEHLLKTVG